MKDNYALESPPGKQNIAEVERTDAPLKRYGLSEVFLPPPAVNTLAVPWIQGSGEGPKVDNGPETIL